MMTEVQESLAAWGADVSLTETTGSGHAEVLARELSGEADVVVAVGGDGTIREVATGLMGTGVPFTIVPAGTENILAKTFGLRARVHDVVDTITRGRRIACDVGRVNGRIFLVVAGFGFDADVVERLANVRRGHISHFHYAQPVLDAWLGHKFPEVRVEADGGVIFEGRCMVLAGLLPRYTIGFRVLTEAIPGDGMIDVCVLPCDGSIKLVGLAIDVLFGRHLSGDGVVYRKCQTLRVSSAERVPFQLDGDVGGEIPAEVTVDARALTILAPPSSRYSWDEMSASMGA
jgi:YegS/Rv2252/BmrU family lipid kinase